MRGRELQDLLDPGGNRISDYLEVSQRHPAGRQLGGRVLFRRSSQRETTGGYRNQDDPYGEEHPKHDRVEGYLCRAGSEQLSRAGESTPEGGGCPELHPVRLHADWEPLWGSHLSL